MASNKDKFGGIFKVKDDDVFSELDEAEKKPVVPKPINPTIGKNRSAPKKNKTSIEPSEKQIYKKYSLYLRPEQHKALKLRSIQSEKPSEKDISAIVRAALDVYLKEELK